MLVSWRNASSLAMRLLWRDRRSGALRLLVLSLLIAVAAVSSVGFFTERVERAMTLQAGDLLAADLVLRDSKPLPETFAAQAVLEGLQSTNTVSFRTVIMADNDRTILAEIKAVEEGYPLRGELKVSHEAYGLGHVVKTLPAVGEAWVESRLLTALQIHLSDQLVVGDRTFKITQVITQEPDRGGSLWQMGPRILINRQDLTLTRLLGPTSLVGYRLLLRGEEAALTRFKAWVKPFLEAGISLQDVENARPEIRSALERARHFLGLAVIVTVLLAGGAIAAAARYFSERQADVSAIMKSLGATQVLISRVYLLRLLMLALIASLAGCSIGFLVQQGLAVMLEGWFLNHLPAPSLMPLMASIATGFVMLLGFALPPILRLKTVSPLRVIRRDLDSPPLSAWMVVATGLGAMIVLIFWQAQNAKLAGIVLSAIAAVLVLSALFAWILLKLLSWLPRYGSALRFGFANLIRRRNTSVLQLLTFSLSIMALLLLTLVRLDLLNTWQTQISENSPNQFLINIQPQERAGFAHYFDAHGLPAPIFSPVVVARLLAVNSKNVSDEDYADERAKWLIERDQRLSYVTNLPSSNTILEGSFGGQATPDNPAWWSLEESFAEGLGLKVGDTLTFKVAEQDVEAIVGSIRKVVWDSMEVNFFVLGSPDLLKNYPATYLSSFYLPDSDTQFMPGLIRSFPGVSVLDVRAILQQLRMIMERAVLAIEYIFGFTLFACLLVLYTTIYTGRDARYKQVSLLRALGGSRKQVLTAFATEFLTLGMLAGFLGALMAGATGYFLAVEVFELDYQFNALLLLIGMLGGGFSVGIAGLLGTLRMLSIPPMRVLNVS